MPPDAKSSSSRIHFFVIGYLCNMRRLPNIVTSLRILGAAAMLFLHANGFAFWTIYALCGISDMLDGYLARRLHCESESGARLDSVADILFTGVCIWKLIPEIAFPKWVWIWIAVIAAVKIINVISSLVVYRKIVLPHTRMNKLTGLMLFILIPLVFRTGRMIIVAILCSVALFAAVEEGHLIRTGRTTL